MQLQKQENESGVVYTPLIVESETTPLAQAASLISATQQDASVSELLTQTKQEVSKWRKRRQRTLGISAVLLLLSFVCISLISFNPRNTTVMMLFSFLIFISSLFGLLAGILMRPIRNNPVLQLWKSENVAAVGPLLEVTQMLLPEVTSKAVEGLVRLLPRMQAGDVALLTNYHRDCLRRLLVERMPSEQIETRQKFYDGLIHRRRELALATLRIFEEIGTDEEISLVQKLAAGEGLARNDKEIQEAAQKCLPIVRTRIAEERSCQTYLRAADAPATPSEVLLRPAAGVKETDRAQLLRANPAKETEQ